MTHCNALGKACWEQHHVAYFGVTSKRIFNCDISLAMAVVRFKLASLSDIPTLEQIVDLETSLRSVSDMRRRQWCGMVREPFSFPIHREGETKSSPSRRGANDSISLTDLGL